MTDTTTDAGSAPAEPEPPKPADSKFVPFALDEFLTSKALWAANFFVLWPLGLALTVDVDRNVDPPIVTDLHVRQWVWPDEPARVETINLEPAENVEEYNHFLRWALPRLMAMTPDERRLAVTRLDQFNIASAKQLLLVGDVA